MEMSYNPIVTIIIPAYNASNFLNEAIDCAINQTYKNVEIIVVNDGSPDEGATEKIALSYGNKIRYIKKNNGGVSSALNLAFENMNGEWFSWLSHDDLYYPNKIEKQVLFLNKLLKEYPNKSLDKIVLHSATESIDISGKVIKKPYYGDIEEKEDFLDVVIGNVYNYRLSGCSFLLPSSCIKDIGNFREDIRTVSDVEYWYRLAFNGYQFYCLKDDVLVKNRSHGKQVGKNKVALFEKELNELFVDITKQIIKHEQCNPKVLVKLYKGYVFRGMHEACYYIKTNALKQSLSPFEYYIYLPISSLLPTLKGNIRNFARYIYRKIYVK